MQNEVLVTGDGSHTLLNKELNATYHSTHGALQESEHIFIRAGFENIATRFEEINVLEIGFGTGLNALLTYRRSQLHKKNVNYTTLEKYPLSQDLSSQLNYAADTEADVFARLHSSSWEETHSISEYFHFTKHRCDVNDFVPKFPIHLVYFDAFAPEDAPDMWQESIFRNLYDCMPVGASLVTFCAKGNFKRLLKFIGFKVEALPGPKGKREMTKAMKSSF